MHIKTAVPIVIVQKKAAAMCLRFHHQPQKQVQRTVKKLHKKTGVSYNVFHKLLVFQNL